MLLVHAGNRLDGDEREQQRFPADHVDAVASRLRALLATLRPSRLVSSAAAGADLIALTEALRLGIPVVILLPIPRRAFASESVADCGPQWLQRYDDVIDAASHDPSSAVVELDLREDPDWYVAANDRLLRVAHEQAVDGEPVLAITVRPPGGEIPPSVTDDFAQRAARCGLVVLTIDPRRASVDIAVD